MDHPAEAHPRILRSVTATWRLTTLSTLASNKPCAVQVVSNWYIKDVQIRQERTPHHRWEQGVNLPTEQLTLDQVYMEAHC